MKKALSLVLALVMSLALLTACGGGSDTPSSNPGGGSADSGLPSYDSLKVGEDYTDITAELHIISHRTDLIDTTFTQYVEEFNKLYPNVTIHWPDGEVLPVDGVFAALP